MRFSNIVLPIALLANGVVSISAASACNADNCARAVTGSAAGPSAVVSRKNDCNSFFLVTVTPATSTQTVFATITQTTSTETVTETSTQTDGATTTATILQRRANGAKMIRVAKEKRTEIAQNPTTVTPSSVPTYASACSGAVRYSSACSCGGAVMRTTTVQTPVITVTVTASATATAFTTTTTVVEVTSTSTTTTAVSVCTSGAVFYASDRTRYVEKCDTVYSGYELLSAVAATYAQCLDDCENYNAAFGGGRCVGVNYNANTLVCSLQYGIATQLTTPIPGVINARIVGNQLCTDGSAYGDIFVDSHGASYTLYCGYNFSGFDFPLACGLHANSAEECAQLCTTNNDQSGTYCAASTFVPSYPYGRNCCLKTINPGNFEPNGGCDSARRH